MKISKDQEFYINLTEEFNKELYNLSDKEINKILKTHKIDRDTFLNEIGRIVLTYNVKEDSLSLKSNEKIVINNSMDKIINDIFKTQTQQELSKVKDVLTNMALDKYYSNAYILSLGLDFKLKKVSEKQLKNIIDKTIEGKLYSDRIWNNKNNVAKALKLEIRKFINGEINLNEIEKTVKTKFSINANNTKRLVRTETARVMEQANEVFADEHNIEYQLFSATLDNLTSEICSNLDGKVFKYDDPDKPICPVHPNCRSTLISLPSKEYRPKTRLNNITKERVDYKTYQEWKDKKDL
ncbi:minor capsid protein [Clostridium sp.]|jgi:SPP1 gp7 family putative phage head morphogenesis protein|uniref:minor capsid protein n=1 Tax=Clostridium sp. TaxID=1506 RepID=UPI002911D4F9|nr:minor capsid protein [Clostridium sp.]MDU7364286.1 minor capsid protein [Clostridium sp.]